MSVLFAVTGLSILSACGKPPRYTTPGVLYFQVAEPARPNHRKVETLMIRDGIVVGHRPAGTVVARDRPDRRLVASKAGICAGPYGLHTYRLSPNGARVLCSDNELLWIYDRNHAGKGRTVASGFQTNADGSSFGWLDNSRFVALVYDKSCPQAHLYDYFASRVITFDIEGRQLSKGVCALGVVTGMHKIALLGEQRNSVAWNIRQFLADDPRYYNNGYKRFHQTWSIDGGKSWHSGTPLAFDGNDRLLYADAFGGRVVSQDGSLVFKGDVRNVSWSR